MFNSIRNYTSLARGAAAIAGCLLAGPASAEELPQLCDYLNTTVCCVPYTLLELLRDWLG